MALTRLLPLRIDASSLGWQRGLQDAVSSAVNTLTTAECAQLGAPQPFDASDPFGWLASLPPHGARKLLLILDQMDDYIVAHQQHFVSRRKVIAPSRLTADNPDWATLSRLITDNRLHVVLVCRADSAALLDALRFTDNIVTYLLPRVEEQLLAPLLDALTHASDQEVVVADPAHGWVQFKSRLLRDVSSGGQILPVQLAVALNSLRRLRYLTPREYERHGSIRGLERLHIERHVHDAARGTGVEATALLRGLLELVHEDGIKTRRISRRAFTVAVQGNDKGEKNLDMALEELERWRIVRRQSEGGEEFLLLYHDYLTRGVRETYRQANRWTELLRQQYQMFTESLGMRQQWRSLLTPGVQMRLLWARLRGRFHFGLYRAFAVWSVLRLLPLAGVLAGIVASVVWGQRTLERHHVERLIHIILDKDESLSREKADAWRALAASKDHARLHAVQYAISEPSIAAKFRQVTGDSELSQGLRANTERFVHTVIGLDVDSSLSRQLIRKVLAPALGTTNPASDAVLAVSLLSVRLHYKTETASTIAAALTNRMATEQDSRTLAWLGEALEPLSAKLDSAAVQPLVNILLRALEDADERHWELVRAWLTLERQANSNRLKKERLPEYVKILQLPLMIGAQRRAVLDGLEKLTDEKFSGDLWRFVTWATTSGKAQPWGVVLTSGRPYRPTGKTGR